MSMQAATLQILEEANLPRAQALAIGRAIDTEISASHSTPATSVELQAVKADMQLLSADLKADMQALRADMQSFGSSFREEMLALGASFRERELEVSLKIATVRSELMRWILGVVSGLTTMVVGAVVFLFDHLHR